MHPNVSMMPSPSSSNFVHFSPSAQSCSKTLHASAGRSPQIKSQPVDAVLSVDDELPSGDELGRLVSE